MGKKLLCPLIKKKCVEHECAWSCNIKGRNPQTGEDVDRWSCVVNSIPILQIEQSQASRANQSATVEVREKIAQLSQLTAASIMENSVLPASVRVDKRLKP